MPFGLFDYLGTMKTWEPTWTITTTTDLSDIVVPTKPKFKKRVLPGIKHIQFNPQTGHTAIVWNDGSEATVVRCGEGEQFEPYMGFCAAIVKKLFGSTSAAKRTMEELDVDKVKARKEEERAAEIAARREQEAMNHQRKVRSMAKRLDLIDEAMELLHDKTSLAELLNTGDKDGDDLDANAV